MTYDGYRGVTDEPNEGPLLVRDVMATELVTIDANSSLAAARDLMLHRAIHHLLVTHQNRVVAVISDRDVLEAISPFLGTLAEQTRDARSQLRPVFQLASYHPVTVTPEAGIEEAAALMLDRGISCLPVTDQAGTTVGIVTSRDLLRGLVSCALPRERPAERRSA